MVGPFPSPISRFQNAFFILHQLLYVIDRPTSVFYLFVCLLQNAHFVLFICLFLFQNNKCLFICLFVGFKMITLSIYLFVCLFQNAQFVLFISLFIFQNNNCLFIYLFVGWLVSK